MNSPGHNSSVIFRAGFTVRSGLIQVEMAGIKQGIYYYTVREGLFPLPLCDTDCNPTLNFLLAINKDHQRMMGGPMVSVVSDS